VPDQKCLTCRWVYPTANDGFRKPQKRGPAQNLRRGREPLFHVPHWRSLADCQAGRSGGWENRDPKIKRTSLVSGPSQGNFSIMGFLARTGGSRKPYGVGWFFGITDQLKINELERKRTNPHPGLPCWIAHRAYQGILGLAQELAKKCLERGM